MSSKQLQQERHAASRRCGVSHERLPGQCQLGAMMNGVEIRVDPGPPPTQYLADDLEVSRP
jgi:hypothetical protein